MAQPRGSPTGAPPGGEPPAQRDLQPRGAAQGEIAPLLEEGVPEPTAGAPAAAAPPAPGDAAPSGGGVAAAARGWWDALRRAVARPDAADADADAAPGGVALPTIPVIDDADGGAAAKNGARPTCLICLEPLPAEDFRSGAAIALGCHCRGDLALRHRECALRWARVRGEADGRGGVPVCELCRHPCRNLPALPARPPPPAAPARPGHPDELYLPDGAHHLDFAPSPADLVFDCVRVTWVAMIVSILFFEMTLGAALWTGVVSGLAYALMVRLLYRQHWAAVRALQLEQQAAMAAAAAAAGGGAPRARAHPLVGVV